MFRLRLLRDCAGSNSEVGKSIKEKCKEARNSPNGFSAPCFNSRLLVTNLQKTNLFGRAFSEYIYIY